MKQRRRKGIKGLILALAIAALVAPAASGQIYLRKSGTEVSPGYSQQALQAMNQRWTKLGESYQVALPPDDRGGVRGAGLSVEPSDYVDRQLANLEAKSAQTVHSDDRAGVRGPGPVETPVVSSTGNGFDWSDAGIGAAIAAFAAALLAVGLMTRRRAGLAV
jgi:hypothetical protein